MKELQTEKINVPEDILAIEHHNQIHSRLVVENAAGSPRLMETLAVAADLASEISSARTGDEDTLTLELDERQQQILRTSRRLGPMALAQ